MRKRFKPILLLLLVFCLLFQSCRTGKPTPTETEPHPSGTAKPSTDAPETIPPTSPSSETQIGSEPIDPSDPALIRYANAGMRDYLGDDVLVEMADFSEMEYARPDVEALYADFDALITQAGETDLAGELLEQYFNLYDRYVDFYTMDNLANIRYSLDTTDPYYKAEYDFCENETPNVEEKLEALYKAFAASPARDALEDEYFGAGYFLQYDDYEVYTNETYLRLSQQEKQILSEYRDLTADPQIEWDGALRSLDELLDTDDYDTYIGALEAYYDKYNPLVGEKFIELIRVRKQLAEALEYDNYADYSYSFSYGRDYTPEQGSAFVKDIETWLVPVYREHRYDQAFYGSTGGRVKESRVKDMVRSAAEQLGGTVSDAYRFMEAYHLFDITQSPVKLDASFETYIYAYEAPFVFVNSQGTSSDYTTFAHEFGHFTDAYYNYNADEDLETAETFSQAMEFLALCYTTELSDRLRNSYLKTQLADVMSTYISQAAFARFEEGVYALPDDELTLDRINAIYLQANKDFSMSEYGFDFYYSKSWIDVIHFFEAPYYVISYCVSADTSLQVYELEKEQKGAGVDAYFRLLDRPYDAGVQEVMEAAELENPFEEGRMERTAGFFRQAFD